VQLGGLGEQYKLPQWGLGWSSSRNQILCILAWNSDIWWHQFFIFPDFSEKYFPLTFPWPLKFPDFFQFSLTRMNPVLLPSRVLPFRGLVRCSLSRLVMSAATRAAIHSTAAVIRSCVSACHTATAMVLIHDRRTGEPTVGSTCWVSTGYGRPGTTERNIRLITCALRMCSTQAFTKRSSLGDRAFPVAVARAWNTLPVSCEQFHLT